MKKAYIITGTTRGLGESIQEVLVQNNKDIFSINRQDLVDHGIKNVLIDLNDTEGLELQLERAFEDLLSDYDLLVFISNAAILEPLKVTSKLSLSEIQTSTNVNFIAPTLLLKFLMNQGKKILAVNLTSGARNSNNKALSLYSSTKLAFYHYLETANLENENLYIMHYDPGMMDTGMQESLRSEGSDFDRHKDFQKIYLNNKLGATTKVALELCNQIDVEIETKIVKPSSEKKIVKVLVSGVGGDVAQGVIKALEVSDLSVEIYKTCIANTSSWLYKDEKSYIVPLSSDIQYIPSLLKIIKKHQIDVFIPCVDVEIPNISKNKEFLESQSSVKVFVDRLDKVECCDDKYLTYKFLSENGFPAPLTVVPTSVEAIENFLSRVSFPILSKFRRGRGAVNVKKILNKKEAYRYLGNKDVVLQEYLEGEEYTTGIYLGDDGAIKGICTLKRELKNGSTFIAQRIVDKRLEFPLERIAKKLGMKYLNIQSIMVNGQLLPFEFNGRFSGTTGIISRIFNAPGMYIREKVFSQNLVKKENDSLFQVMRYYEEIYTDSCSIKKLMERSASL